MFQKLTRSIRLFIFGAFCSAQCFAQLGPSIQLEAKSGASGPSLEETQKWIKDAFEKEFKGTHAILFEQCDAMYFGAELSNNPRPGKFYEANRFPLAQMAAPKVSSGGSSIQIDTLNGKRVITFRQLSENKGGLTYGTYEEEFRLVKLYPYLSPMTSITIYPISSRIYAERLANAIDHAIKLCQKIELDETTKKMQNEYNKNSKKQGDLF